MKRVGVELGTATQGYFQGVGIIAVSIPNHENEIFFLYPAFFSSTDKYNTASTGALVSSAGFKNVVLDTHQQLELTSKEGKCFTLPCTVIDDIDFVKFHIHILHKQSTQKSKRRKQHQYRLMSLQPVSLTNKSVVGTSLFTGWLHIIYNHRSIANLQQMINKGIITGPGLPCKLAPLPGRCPICDAAKMTKIPRIVMTDHTPLPLGTRFHVDYAFFNHVSIRGFHATLIIVESTSRYLWVFPSRSKSAPIDLCLYFFNQLQRQGFPCIRMRSDEDGALINNTEFCKMMYKNLGMTMESTGGRESTINGAAESPIRTLKNGVRAGLIGSSLSNDFHCFAAQHTPWAYNNVLHSATGQCPSKMFTGKVLPIQRMHPFGAKVKVHAHVPKERSLTARTSGDSRVETDYNVNAVTIIDASEKSSYTGRFLGYSNHVNALLVLKEGEGDEPSRVIRAHHALVDVFGLSTSDSDKPTPNERLLQALHNQVFDTTAPTKWQAELEQCELDTVDSPFDPELCETFTITLPPQGRALGIYIDTDEDYLLPIIGKISKEYRLFDEIPLHHHYYKSWVVQVGNDNPITGQGFIESIRSMQHETDDRQIEITLCPMEDPVRYHHQTFRAFFDSATGLKYTHMITLPYEPKTYPSVFKALDSDLGHEWEQALYHQYDKNDNVHLVAQPTPIENVPKNRKVLPAVMSTKVKKKGQDLYQLVTRMCANGSKQQQGIDYEFSYSPTAGGASIRITLCLSASWRLTLAIIDVVNCFQSTLLPQEERLIITMPPLYKKWFQSKYPNVKWEESPSGKYVLELLNGLQGDKSIGRKWYKLLKRFLERFGFKMCLFEPSLFVYQKDGFFMILNTSTDDFLCGYNDRIIFDRLCTALRKLFDITVKEGTQLSYLNLRIIQSEHGVSYDQTEHIIHKIINKYFPPSKIEESKLKPVHTPFRTDSEYEKELMEQLPATGQELKALEERYGGTFAGILGELMHVECISRFDLSYTIRRLGAYTHAPNAAAFAGLYRALRFLATHPHRPIFYPNRKMDGYDDLTVHFDPPKFNSIKIPQGLCNIVDSDHARNNATRKSYHCSISLLNGVGIHNKMQQQKTIALHSTHSEIVGTLVSTKEGMHIQNICAFIGIPYDLIKPLQIFGDSQPCIDACEANSVTTRVKHLAVSIAYIHEQIEANIIKLEKIDTTLNIADSGTKPNPSPIHFRHYDYIIGVRFYPPIESEHYQLLELHKFIKSPYTKDQMEFDTNNNSDDPICSESTSQDSV